MKSKFLKSLGILLISGAIIMSGCSSVFRDETPIIPHTHEYTTSIIDPTQTDLGYTLHSCTCGNNYKESYTCLLSYENLDNVQGLPQVEPQIVPINTKFKGVDNVGNYSATSYRTYITNDYYSNLYVGQLITNSTNIKLSWNNNTLLDDTMIEFNNLIAKIKKLEQISIQYSFDNNSANDPQIRVLQYIRQSRYSSSQWNVFGGKLESNFSKYVTDNQDEFDLASLQSLDSFTIPNLNQDVDFVHLMAIINVALKYGLNNNSTNDMVGWGGDICQLVKQLKDKDLAGYQLQSEADRLLGLGGSESSFGDQDLYADIDALNIANIYNNVEQKSISNVFKQYYLGLTSAQRKIDVLKVAFPTYINSSTGEIIKNSNNEEDIDYISNSLYSRLDSNIFIKTWCQNNGVNLTNDEEEFKASTTAFAKYLVNKK